MGKNSLKPKMFAKAIIVLVSSVFVLLTASGFHNVVMGYGQSDSTRLQANEIAADEKKVVYLSDLDYITENNWSYNGWAGHSLQKDKNPDGGTISLIVNGEKMPFSKGLGIHAKGQMVFDISEYSSKFTRFTAKIGVDAARDKESKLWFEIFVSDDGQEWTSMLKTDNILFQQEAIDVDIDVTGKKYLRIYVDPAGSNSADHGVLASAALVTADYTLNTEPYTKIQKVEEYDNVLKQNNAEYNYNNNYRLILEREFVNIFNYWLIQDTVNVRPEMKEFYDWILDGNEKLEEIIEVGKIDKTSVFMDLLSQLYFEYKDDLNTENARTYQKMMIALAADYSTSWGTDFFLSPFNFYPSTSGPRPYDPMERFRLYKQLYDEDKLLHKDWFDNYHMELMRMIMEDSVANDELLWLNNYIREYRNGNLNAVNYVPYIDPPVYGRKEFFDPANQEKYDAKYHFVEFGVPYGGNAGDKTNHRYWMTFEAGGICWNISRVGSGLSRSVGLPSQALYQPNHEVYLFYSQDENGNGFWSIGNDVFGWGRSSTTWYGTHPRRLIFNWNNKYFADKMMNSSHTGTNSGYVYLAQANLNNLEAYRKSFYLNLLSNIYEDNETKLQIYNQALEVNDINLDSYDYKIKMYEALNKSADEWRGLADDIIKAYQFYPNAMVDLLKIIKPHLDTVGLMDINMQERAALQAATKATNDDIWQYNACKSLANALLGKNNAELAKFSFDGENAGKIVFNDAYQEMNFSWYYSLDGGNTLSGMITDPTYQLPPEDIAKITADNDIQIAIAGIGDLTPDYTIAIEKGTIDTKLLYGNDWENRVIGIDSTYEWRYDEADEWTSYSVALPDNTGDTTLYVRKGYVKNNVPSDEATFTFTKDNQPDTAKYIPISHLSVAAYSSQSKDSKRPFYAPNAIDGNINTLWHTDFSQNVLQQPTKPYYTIKLDQGRYLSAVEFAQIQYKTNDPSYIKNLIVYVSDDGENWTQVGRLDNCPKNLKLKRLDLTESVYGQYVKLEMDTYDMFSCLAMVNLYEDTTKIPPTPAPDADVEYSTSELTNQSVIATLVSESENMKILNNDGSRTYTFTENGEFTFEYVDATCTVNCATGKAKAKVDWIDKVAPTAKIEYSVKGPTKENVTATLVNISEEITVTNNGGNKAYTFTKNGSFTFEFVDKAGNKGTATAIVDWIDRTPPTGEIEYSAKGANNNTVVATLRTKEEVKILNNGGKNTYVFLKNGSFTFEFADAAGNKGTATATVDWIGKDSGNKPNGGQNNSQGNTSNNNQNNTQGKPSNGNQSGAQGNNQNSIANANKPYYESMNMNTDTDSKNYQTITGEHSNVSVKLPGSLLSKFKDPVLVYETFTLSDMEKERFGKESEMYEVRIRTKDNKTIDVQDEKIEQRVRLNPNKKLVAVYCLNEDGSYVKLDYDINDDNEIVFHTRGLSRYIISYQSTEKETAEDTETKNDTNKRVDAQQPFMEEEETSFMDNVYIIIPYIMIGAILVAGGILIVTFKKHKDAGDAS